MIIFPPILYLISDYLMDQKDSLNRLDVLHKRTHNSDKRREIQEEKKYLYDQGLRVLHCRHREKIPTCIKAYYLGTTKKKPSMDEINSELRRINRYRDYKLNLRVIRGVVITIMAILLLFALLP